MKKTNYSVGASLVVMSSLFYASYGIWTTLIGDFLGGFTASALRSILVLAILIPIAAYRKELMSFNIKGNSKRLLAMVIISALIWGLLYYSVLEAGIGISFTVNYAAIVIGMLFFGSLLAKEKITSDKKTSASIGLIGLTLVFLSTATGDLSILPLIAALISGLAVAANTVVAKQLPYSTTQATLALWTTSVFANVPMVFILNEPTPSFGLHIEWIYLLIFAIASVLASWMLLKGLKHIDAGLAGILGLLEIVFGVIFGVVLFSEKIEPLAGVGTLVILLAAIIPGLNARSSSKTKKN